MTFLLWSALIVVLMVAMCLIGDLFIEFESWLERRDYQKHFND
jgi:hypothetical protein